jgi:hypothetical protein
MVLNMDKYVKVPIFPITKYMAAKERKQMPAPMKPLSFMFGDDKILVDAVLDCDRGVSRKVGGRGFRYLCKVRWHTGAYWRTKESVLWYDDFLQEWFVETPQSRAPVDWEAATQLSDLSGFLE